MYLDAASGIVAFIDVISKKVVNPCEKRLLVAYMQSKYKMSINNGGRLPDLCLCLSYYEEKTTLYRIAFSINTFLLRQIIKIFRFDSSIPISTELVVSRPNVQQFDHFLIGINHNKLHSLQVIFRSYLHS